MKYLKNIKILIILLFFFIITDNNNKKSEFISLDKLTFINDYYKDSVSISYFILIDNPNSEKDSLKHQIMNYVKSRLDNEKKMTQKNITAIGFNFYRKSDNTSYFIENGEDPGGFSSEEISHYKKDLIANYYINKSGEGTKEELYFFYE